MLSTDWKSLIPADFSEQARVWIFQSNRPFSEQEQKEINEQLHQFYAQWLSHGAPVKGWAGLLFGRFIVVLADEAGAQVGGCSTDSMMRVMKSLERQYSIQLFDRLTLTFLLGDKAEMLPYGQLQYALDKGYIKADTLFFNNVAATKKELLESWIVPVNQSWLAQRLEMPG